MEEKAHAIIAVAFLLLMGAGAGVVAWWMTASSAQVKIYDIVSPYSVSGLTADQPVQYKGVSVGSVLSVGLDPSNPRDVLIRISVVRNAPITHATYAELASQGITGGQYVALGEEPKGDHHPLATSPRHPARIPVRQSLLPRLEHSGEALIGHGDAVLSRLDHLLSERNVSNVTETLAHLARASARVGAIEDRATRTLGRVDKLLGATDRTRIADLLANFDRASKRMLVLEASADRAIGHLTRLTDQAQRSTRQASALLRTLRADARSGGRLEGVLGNSTLPRINQLLGALDRVSVQLDALARELRATPQALIFGRPPPRPGPGEPGYTPPTEEGSGR